MKGAKKGYDSVVTENKELKKYLANIKQRTNSTGNSNKTNILKEKEIIFKKNSLKHIRK